ncbi:hypothetical protein ASPZODRAFT_14288 [Penicilliopsis zonata CBS 506.65]|uniref:Uncharacterized protein n=1 Tax=Penicilliopsis zonata CBS 506.65 TaxID=1073090 RepID=A0A1L9SM62_9EURO|nr:hypothetical protein ASPZODRAFT_14288 [Penicilliopsis zonata CBS 506.65]OJJ48137.1 hypothetical protein ASPZODRAFT_14288 [Penicilliopsis zonata CBS 506.65]
MTGGGGDSPWWDPAAVWEFVGPAVRLPRKIPIKLQRRDSETSLPTTPLPGHPPRVVNVGSIVAARRVDFLGVCACASQSQLPPPAPQRFPASPSRRRARPFIIFYYYYYYFPPFYFLPARRSAQPYRRNRPSAARATHGTHAYSYFSWPACATCAIPLSTLAAPLGLFGARRHLHAELHARDCLRQQKQLLGQAWAC